MKYEKEMIPILNQYFMNKMGFPIVKNEINSGYGIADVVAAKKNKEHLNFVFNNIFEVDFLISMPYKNWIAFDSIIQHSQYSANYLKYHLLKQFVDAGLVCKKNNYYKRTKRMKMPKTTIVAVEAKLCKWKDAFRQALRYRKYADYSYVAILEKSIKNVDIDLLNKNHIGVIYIDKNDKVKTFIKANIHNEKDTLYSLFVNSLIFS